MNPYRWEHRFSMLSFLSEFIHIIDNIYNYIKITIKDKNEPIIYELNKRKKSNNNSTSINVTEFARNILQSNYNIQKSIHNV